MTLKYGNTINEIESDYQERSWYKPAAEFAVMAVILILVLAGVTYRASTKSVVISESSGLVAGESLFDEDVITDWTIMPVSETKGSKSIIVPIPITARPENVYVENYYQDHTLFIRIKGLHSAAFEGSVISGNTKHLITAAFREYSGEIRISLVMDGVWDYSISQENTQLVITPFKPDEKYERSIVLVTEKAETVESELGTFTKESLAAKIAEYAADMSIGGEKEESAGDEDEQDNSGEEALSSTRIFVAEYRSDEEVLAFIDEVNADFVVFLKTGKSDDPGMYGMSAVYNGSYFIPELDNAYLTEVFLRNMAIAAKDRAVSIEKADKESILEKLTIPATEITVGYVTNESEKKCLENESYRKKVARGIINAVKEVTER